MGKKKKRPLTTVEAVRKIRGTWGNVNPVTRVIPNKKKYKRQQKYKGYKEEE